MNRHFKKIALCALLLGLTPYQGFAEEERTAQTVVVTAGRIEESAKTVTQSVTVISPEEIEKNSTKTLTDVLHQNGIATHRSGGFGTTAAPTIMLRGLRSNGDDPSASYVMILVDGHRMGSTNIEMIPMSSIERVEILRGPAAVQYGSTAMGGVVNIITKRGSEKTSAYVELGGGSWESWKGVFGLSGMMGDVDYSLGIQHSVRNGDWSTGDGTTINNTSYGGMTGYNASLGYNFLEEHRIGVSVVGSEFDEVGDWGGTYAYNYNTWGYDYMPHGSSPRASSDRDNYSILLDYDGGVKDYGLSWKLSYNNSRGKYYWNDPDSTSPAYDNVTKNQGVQAQLSWKYNFLTLTGGVDWSEDTYRAYYNTENKEREMDDVGGFLLAKAALFDEKLVLSAGVRYDDYTLKYDGKESDKDNVSLSAGVVVNPLDWLSLRANIGEAYRMPGGMEVVGYANSWGQSFIGNPNLDPEKGLGWDVGFDVQKYGFRAGLTYFATDYKDKITTRMLPTGDYEYYNLSGTTKYRGLEGHASFDLGEAFEWDFMLQPYVTFTHMIDYEDEKGNELSYVRDWVAGFGIKYGHPSIGLDMDLSFTYFGDQKEGNFYRPNLPNPMTTGGDITADFMISKTLKEWVDYGTLSIKGEVRNIFDKEYSLTDGYPMPGRSFYLGLVWKY